MATVLPRVKSLFTFGLKISPLECQLQLQTLNRFNCLTLNDFVIMNSQTLMLRQTYI
jgi:hypothetical protein